MPVFSILLNVEPGDEDITVDNIEDIAEKARKTVLEELPYASVDVDVDELEP
jgi:divalent metal cation (Fe/Co/Zn/Cd) transporter